MSGSILPPFAETAASLGYPWTTRQRSGIGASGRDPASPFGGLARNAGNLSHRLHLLIYTSLRPLFTLYRTLLSRREALPGFVGGPV
jgi:hypothetical protein